MTLESIAEWLSQTRMLSGTIEGVKKFTYDVNQMSESLQQFSNVTTINIEQFNKAWAKIIDASVVDWLAVDIQNEEEYVDSSTTGTQTKQDSSQATLTASFGEWPRYNAALAKSSPAPQIVENSISFDELMGFRGDKNDN